MTKILLIEDNTDVRLLLGRRLAAHRFEILEAADGKSGLEQAQRGRPDLIVLDLNLPGEDGFKVYQSLRQEEAMREIPVLFLTAVSTGGKMTAESLALIATAKHGILLQGRYAVMGKPYEPRELVERIRQLLEESRGSEAQLHEDNQAT